MFLRLDLQALQGRLSSYEAQLQARRLKQNTVHRRLATIRLFHSWAREQMGLVPLGRLPMTRLQSRESSSFEAPWLGAIENEIHKARTHGGWPGGGTPDTGRSALTTQAPTAEELKRLLEAPDTATARGLRDKAILHLLAKHALHRAEVCALNREHLLEKQQLLWVPVKGHQESGVPMPLSPESVTILRAYAGTLPLPKERDAGGPLFRSVPRGQPLQGDAFTLERLTIDGIYYLVRSYGKGVELPHLSSRQLRHRAILQVLEEEAGDIEKAGQRLPHISQDVLARYRG
jgi:integrase